ncbi:MAG: hypothetical protein QOD52_2964 [Gaiellaceae bacterium]|nr:hypothetical protein [Gaiellaceae bacterium]
MSIRREIAETLRPRRGDKDGLLPPLFLALTFVTGVVDATSYLRLGHVFVANMTGNVVFLGFGIAGATGISVLASLTALASFLVGSAIGGRIAVASGDERHRHLRLALGVQTALVATAAVVVAFAGRHVAADARYPLIALLSVAMGVQNAAARKLAVADLTTTVLTMTLVGVAADSTLAGGNGARLGRRGLSVAAMLLGALAGGLLALRVDNVAPLGLVTAVLVVVVLLATLDPST